MIKTRNIAITLAACALGALALAASAQSSSSGSSSRGGSQRPQQGGGQNQQGQQGQQGQGQRQGGRRPPPQEAIKACSGKTEKASCSFTGRNSEALSGTCMGPPPDANAPKDAPLACRPANMPPPDDNGGEGGQGGQGGQRGQGGMQGPPQ